MSYELIAILVVGAAMGLAQFAAIVIAVSGFGAMDREMRRSFEAMDARFEKTTREINRSFDARDARFEKSSGGLEELRRTRRAIEALVVLKSEKIQTLLRT